MAFIHPFHHIFHMQLQLSNLMTTYRLKAFPVRRNAWYIVVQKALKASYYAKHATRPLFLPPEWGIPSVNNSVMS